MDRLIIKLGEKEAENNVLVNKILELKDAEINRKNEEVQMNEYFAKKEAALELYSA